MSTGEWRVLDWPEMFPAKEDPLDVLADPKKRRAIHYAIQLYFLKPSVRKTDINGRIPTFLQNYYEKAKNGKLLQNFDQERNRFYSLQNISVSTDFEKEWHKLRDQYREATLYDNRFEMIYKNIPLSGSTTWTIRTMSGTPVHRRIYEGGKIEYGGFSDKKFTAEVAFYGGGVGIQRQAILSRDFVAIEDLLSFLRDSTYRKMGEVYYGLLELVSGAQDINWQVTNVAATDASYRAKRDINTMNFAAQKIIDDCKGKGYGDLTQATYIVLHDHKDTQRIKEALSISLEPYSGSQKIASYNFMPISTTMLTDTNYYYVILPGNKIQKAQLLAPTRFQEFDQDTFLEKFADWMAFGGIVFDEQQVTRCAKA